jgi:SAM-dependent methyltransferase
VGSLLAKVISVPATLAVSYMPRLPAVAPKFWMWISAPGARGNGMLSIKPDVPTSRTRACTELRGWFDFRRAMAANLMPGFRVADSRMKGLCMAKTKARKRAISPIQFSILLYGSLLTLLILLHFPYATDKQTEKVPVDRPATGFYEQVYAETVGFSPDEATKDDAYASATKAWNDANHPEEELKEFVAQYHLENKRVLEVGSGAGYLQDVVKDYTGLDISPSARRHYHKPFVAASATEMPFQPGSFDVIWTINVLEHVPNPESMLREMRRVLKPGGLLYVYYSWQAPPWAAQGYEVRPYSDFSLLGKLEKATLPIQQSLTFQALYILPVRFIRYAQTHVSSGPSAFHYHRLTPNYEHYWVPDSDAVNSMDPYEAVLWFETRGDQCVNCPSGIGGIMGTPGKLVIRVKPGGEKSGG